MKKIIPMILESIMTIVFWIICKDWIINNNVSFNFIFEDMDKYSNNFQRIIATIFFAGMLFLPIFFTESKIIPYIYIFILIIGAAVTQGRFLAYAMFGYYIMGILLGGLVSIVTGIISFIFPGFSAVGIWFVRICQIFGGIGMAAVIANTIAFMKEEMEDIRTSKASGSTIHTENLSYLDRDFVKEHEEKQKMEILKDIDWQLKNRK